ncbi:MAG: hypothetical protein AB8B95_01980 [Pseudohongiellaceae bacterium]
MNADETELNDTHSAEIQSLLRAEKNIIRLTFWQTILSLVGVAIAVIALYAALKESAAVRQQTSAAVWPYVQLMIENYDSEEGAGFSLAFQNAGVGPAKMQDVRISIDDNIIRNWSEFVARVDGDVSVGINRNFISDRVLRPDESVVMFSTNDRDLALKLVDAVSNPRGAVSYCYCSIFDECWFVDTAKEQEAPETVQACPEYGDDTYRN